ncbi:MAG: DUF2153 family protein [Desulfurococcaceae archaeon]
MGEVVASIDRWNRWVKMQQAALDSFKKAEENYKSADRLELLFLNRMAFQHIIRTADGFAHWLEDPLITSHMPREMLVELWEKVKEILYDLIRLDMEHTAKFSEHLKKLADEGKLNPLLSYSVKSEKESRRLTVQI